ncbi:MAG: sensor histidine kinase KdpD [Oscillospiraceae bacterium]|nr:sensor histidine kinase KdpD [Oscillospiraceae bacterium]
MGNGHREGERILVCLSPSPSNPKVIQAAAKLASAFSGTMTALFVETPSYSRLAEEDKDRLRSHMSLAQSLGAKIETVSGDDVPFQIAEYARLADVTKIVLGQSSTGGGPLGFRKSLVDRVIALAPELDLYIIPDRDARPYSPRLHQELDRREIARDAVVSLGCLAAATLVGFLFQNLGFTDANIIMMYLLGLLVVSAVTSHRVYSLVFSVVSVLLFDLLFTRPRFSFLAYDTGYPVTFIVMFAVAFFISSLAIRLKENERQSAKTARRMSIVLETDKMLSAASGREEILSVLQGQLSRLSGREVRVMSGGGAAEPGCTCFSIPVDGAEYGRVAVKTADSALDAAEKGMLVSVIGECALALENHENRRKKEESLLLAENERLRANLLRSVSHDLRTPLTSILGNADNLLSGDGSFDRAARRELYRAIYDDSLWLIGLVENLISLSRMEGGQVTLNISSELIADIISEAVSRLGRRLEGYSVTVHHEDDLALVQADARLCVQVAVNLLDNAVKYTPAGTEIRIESFPRGGEVHVRISDNGDGVPEAELDKIFDMFYTGSGTLADSRRSLGLGLSLCRAIVKAHGGRIWAEKNSPRGTAFEFTLPRGEVTMDE